MNLIQALVLGVLGGIALLLTIALAVCLGAVINGFVLTKLWLWFIVPYFGFAPISIPLAIGLGLIVSFLTVGINYSKKEDNPAQIQANFWGGLMRPFIALLVGWIVHAWFMPKDIQPMFKANPIVQTVEAPK